MPDDLADLADEFEALLVARYGREFCPSCHRAFEGFGDEPRAELAAHVAREHWPPSLFLPDGTPDQDMLDAMAEVDALAPAAPPISPGIHNQEGPWPEPPPLPAPDLDLFPTVSK